MVIPRRRTKMKRPWIPSNPVVFHLFGYFLYGLHAEWPKTHKLLKDFSWFAHNFSMDYTQTNSKCMSRITSCASLSTLHTTANLFCGASDSPDFHIYSYLIISIMLRCLQDKTKYIQFVMQAFTNIDLCCIIDMDMQNAAQISFNKVSCGLQTKILARLPVEFVYKFHIINKQWKKFLSSQYFLRKWSEVALNRQPWLVFCSKILNMPSMAFCFYKHIWINSCFTLSFMEDLLYETCKIYCNESVPRLILVIRSRSYNGSVCNPYMRAFDDILGP